ncbi:MAG TPA: hypothetical protein VFG89_05755 [Coriobacteriia bacterium]|nr:hypothetical protein [Coriobacteriia bacterium]
MKRANLARTVAVAVLAGAMVAASAAYAAPVKNMVTEKAISTAGSTTSPMDGGDTDVYGTKVVYNEMSSAGDYDVYLFDTVSGLSAPIASSEAEDRYPKIYGDYVAYTRNGSTIQLYRISTGKTKQIASSTVWNSAVDVYANKVVYSKYNKTTKSLDVYAYDIGTGSTKLLVTGKQSDGTYSNDAAIAIYGNNVIYLANSKDLRACSIKTGKTVSLGVQGLSMNRDPYQVRRNIPAIYQNTVTYVATASGFDHVFAYDLVTKVRTQVSQDATIHANPTIDGTRIVYESGSVADPQLMLYDIKAKATWTLNVNKAMQPSIWGDRLAWTDLRNAAVDYQYNDYTSWKNEDVYTGTLDTVRIAIAGPATIAYSAPATYAATVTNPDGSSVGNGTDLGFEVSADGINWTSLGTGPTASGSVTATLPATPSKRYVRFWYGGKSATPGNPGAVPTVSGVVTVKPKVSVGTPAAPASVKAKKSFTVTGTLKPKHASGSKPVRVYKYKWTSGKWKSYGYVKATASNYSGYSRYKVKMSLPSKGTWKLQAKAPADSLHADTWSSKYDKVKVK